MSKVTDEMYIAGALAFVSNQTEEVHIAIRRVINAAFEVYKQSKPKHELVGYTSKKELRLLSMGYRAYVWSDNEEDGCDIPLYTTLPTLDHGNEKPKQG